LTAAQLFPAASNAAAWEAAWIAGGGHEKKVWPRKFDRIFRKFVEWKILEVD